MDTLAKINYARISIPGNKPEQIQLWSLFLVRPPLNVVDTSESQDESSLCSGACSANMKGGGGDKLTLMI